MLKIVETLCGVVHSLTKLHTGGRLVSVLSYMHVHTLRPFCDRLVHEEAPPKYQFKFRYVK